MSKQQREALDAMLRSALGSEMPSSLEEVRAGFAASMTRPVPQGVVTRSSVLGGRPALELEPTGFSGQRRLLYLHGGCFVLGSAEVHRGLAGELAVRAGLRVTSLDYRLAPEHPFPAAIDDVLAAYRELLASGTDPRDLVLAGDSAGACLAIAGLLKAREAGLPQPAAVVLFSPWVDLTLSGATVRSKEEADAVFTEPLLRQFSDLYMGTNDRVQGLASPAFGDLSGLPPLFLQAGANEMLLDDAVRLAGRAGADDVEVTLEVWPGLPHAFQFHHGRVDEADSAIDNAVQFLTRHLDAQDADVDLGSGAASPRATVE
jgi:epsilon-lactone hydrolase